MKKYFCTLILTTVSVFNAFSQNLVEDFNLSLPENKTKGNFSKLIVIDARRDTTNMGIIQKGAFNRKAFLKPIIPLKTQINTVFNKLVDVNSSNNELMLYLRDFKFAEITGAFSETGYCYFRADIFSKKDSIYQKIDSVDTVLTVNAMDVTKKNIKNGSEKLIQFLTSNLVEKKTGPNYTLEDIKNLESLEKRKIPVYNTKFYKDGIYMAYYNFKTQTPINSEFVVTKSKNDRVLMIERIKKDGTKIEISNEEVYCVIDKGKIYISSYYGYSPVEFKDDDFYFSGKAKVTAKTGNVILASAFFGILGGIIAADASSNFLMKIDHLNGEAIQIKQISE